MEGLGRERDEDKPKSSPLCGPGFDLQPLCLVASLPCCLLFALLPCCLVALSFIRSSPFALRSYARASLPCCLSFAIRHSPFNGAIPWHSRKSNLRNEAI